MVAAHLIEAPRISIPAGDDASGLAEMVASLLEANVADSRSRAAVARLARGALVLTTTDRDVSVTLTFHGGDVVVTDGVSEGAPSLAGPWLELAHVCSGTRSPFPAIAHGDLRVAPGHRPDLVAMAGYILAAPAEADAIAARRSRVVLAVLVLLVVAAVVRSRARRPDLYKP